MSLPARLVEIAQREVGVREVGGNNRGPRIVVYQQATWLPPGDWPWCAAFVAYCLREALLAEGVSPAKADAWRCRDASAFGWLTWAHRTAGVRVLAPDAQEQAGDLPVFDFNGPTAAGGGHIGLVERWAPGDVFSSIEGNTNDAGARDSTTGDGVLRKSRGTRSVINFIRLPERLA